MILEPALRHILRCNRCNVPYVRSGAPSPHLWTTIALSIAFAPDVPVVAGEWTRIRDRVLCPGCWKFSGSDEQPVECEPLDAQEAARVAAEQRSYGHLTVAAGDGDESRVSWAHEQIDGGFRGDWEVLERRVVAREKEAHSGGGSG